MLLVYTPGPPAPRLQRALEAAHVDRLMRLLGRKSLGGLAGRLDRRLRDVASSKVTSKDPTIRRHLHFCLVETLVTWPRMEAPSGIIL